MKKAIKVDSKFSAGTINVIVSPVFTGVSELMKQLIISDLKLGRAVTYLTSELSKQEVEQEFDQQDVTNLYYYDGALSSIPEDINNAINEINIESESNNSLVIANLPSDKLHETVASMYDKVQEYQFTVYISIQQHRDGTTDIDTTSIRQFINYLGVGELEDNTYGVREVINVDPEYNYIRLRN